MWTAAKLALIVNFLVYGMYARAEDTSRADRRAPYIYCNVYLSTACFGIAAGDKLTMEIPADYVVYRIKFSWAAEATIYVGGFPELIEETPPFLPCRRNNGFRECKQRQLKGGGAELLARGRNGNSIHILVAANAHADDTESFLENVRSCTKEDRSIACAP